MTWEYVKKGAATGMTGAYTYAYPIRDSGTYYMGLIS